MAVGDKKRIAFFDDISKKNVGLSNVDNTSDMNKPISTAQQIEFSNKATTNDLTTHTQDTDIHITTIERETWNNKQDVLTFDDIPKSGSNNPVVSSGIYSELQTKVPWTEYSNPNLLDNWYFINPIDQRNGYIVNSGVTYYSDSALTASAGTTTKATTAKYVNSTYGTITISNTLYYVAAADVVRGYANNGYTIDRWLFSSYSDSALTVENGYITITKGKNATSPPGIRQFFENNLDGRTITISTLLSDNKLLYTTFSPVSANATGWQLSHKTEDGSLWLGFQHCNYSTETYCLAITNDSQISIKAIKLELGDHQTLAHQDVDGNWILNDPPPNKVLEDFKRTSTPVNNDGKGANNATEAISALGFANKPKYATITLTPAGWSTNTPYTQTVIVTGVTATNIIISSPDPSCYELASSTGVYCFAQATDSLTFICKKKSTQDLTFNVVIQEV